MTLVASLCIPYQCCFFTNTGNREVTQVPSLRHLACDVEGSGAAIWRIGGVSGLRESFDACYCSHMTTNESTPKVRFETETCTRCLGSGRMPYSVYGGVCFKCGGKGECLSRRGLAARKAFYAARAAACGTKALADVELGETVSFDGGSDWIRVAVKGDGGARVLVEGEWVRTVMVRNAKGKNMSAQPTREVLVYSPAAQLAAVERVRKMKGAIIGE